ncbi:MAG TPA: tRNA epoxyqueuosine(34) reductase QueG, partial [Gemmatimonadales bacterium]|nr:tRNA epoxyqueuosine(34) reductase QueG [Gemmatimonadales bacterium]
DPQLADKVAKRAIVVLDSYYYEASEDASRPKVARYARGTDYHTVTRKRLELLADFLRHNGAQTARAYTDSGPIAERELAQRAGLGWIGKNTMLIRPGQGSWMFIGTVLTDLELEIDPPFETDHCGSCTRCLEACPTQAFESPRVLDATRCISYLTIEHRGPLPAKLIDRFEGWAFGCDICNEVCPWNVRFASESSVTEFRPRATLADAGPEFFDELDEPAFAASFGDTPLQRPGLERMRRNWRAAWNSLRP